MDSNPIIQEMIDKTFREMRETKRPLERSRMASSSNGYIHLIAWSNAQLLRIIVRIFTSSLPKSEFRLKAQLDDAARSVIANIEEGFRRPTTMEYMTFLGYSQASLIEVKGDIQRCLQDGFLRSIPHASLKDIGIDLEKWHEAVKQSVISHPLDSKGNYRSLEECKDINRHQNFSSQSKNYSTTSQNYSNQNHLYSYRFFYPPVDRLTAGQLTYELFIELINKTDWHLRRLVVSLEDKLSRDQKYYQVEKARIRGNATWRR